MQRTVRRALWSVWVISFALALACTSVFAYGLIRDTRPFDPEVRVDLSSASEWASTPFIVVGEASYRLLLRVVNHQASKIGHPLTATFDVRVLAPGGDVVFERTFEPAEPGFLLPDNYGDTTLADLPLPGRSIGFWRLQVRVTEPDSALVGVLTRIDLHEDRQDVGMGGLINYAMIFPAAVFMLLALGLAIPLARQGTRVPLVASVVGTVCMALALG